MADRDSTLTYAPGTGPTALQKASFSIPSILAAVCVILIIVTNWFDFVLGLLAIVFGLIGAIMALSPKVRGGILSIAAIVIGLASMVISIFQLVF